MSTAVTTRAALDPPSGLEELAKLTRSLVEAHERQEMSAETPAERRHRAVAAAGAVARRGDSMRVLAYVRASTEEQAESGAGLAAQRETILAECRRRGWELVEVIEDAGYSAKDLKRPGIQAALRALRAKEAEALVVAKLDRLSRSMLDFPPLMARAQKEGWALVALDVGMDTTTPAGEMTANVTATFAQFERRLIGQRTREALAAKRAQGVRLGRPRQLPDHVIARIVGERSNGASLTAIARALDRDGVPTAQGGKRWYPATVRAVLRSAERYPLAGALAVG